MHKDHWYDFHLGLDNVQNEKQLQERVELLTRLDKCLEEALKNEGDPTVLRANLSLVTIPLGVDVDLSRDEGHYGSSTPSVLVFFWDRLATGGFAVRTITGGSDKRVIASLNADCPGPTASTKRGKG